MAAAAEVKLPFTNPNITFFSLGVGGGGGGWELSLSFINNYPAPHMQSEGQITSCGIDSLYITGQYVP